MSRYAYSGETRFRPITAWGYVGYTLLFSIPVIGWLFLVFFTFSGSSINRRSFARSFWCFLLLAAIIFTVSFFGVFRLLGDSLPQGMQAAIDEAKGFVVRAFDGNFKTPFAPSATPTSQSLAAPAAFASTDISKPPVAAQSAAATSVPATRPGGVTPEFKAMMDAYEEFFDDYIAFMQSFQNSPSNLSLMLEYVEFTSKYADMMTKLDAYKQEPLSKADEDYYVKALLRINNKLAAAALKD